MIYTRKELIELVKTSKIKLCTYALINQGVRLYVASGDLKSVLKVDEEYQPLKKSVFKKHKPYRLEYEIIETFKNRREIK